MPGVGKMLIGRDREVLGRSAPDRWAYLLFVGFMFFVVITSSSTSSTLILDPRVRLGGVGGGRGVRDERGPRSSARRPRRRRLGGGPATRRRRAPSRPWRAPTSGRRSRSSPSPCSCCSSSPRSRALDRAAVPLRPLPGRSPRHPAGAGLGELLRPGLLAGHRRAGARHPFGHPLRAADLAPRRARLGGAGGSSSGRWSGLVAAYRGAGWLDATINLRFHRRSCSSRSRTILVALILLVILGRGVDKIVFALGRGAMGLFRPHGARRRARRERARVHRGGAGAS